jgi:hypothetical protein
MKPITSRRTWRPATAGTIAAINAKVSPSRSSLPLARRGQYGTFALVRKFDPSYLFEGTVNESPVRIFALDGSWSDRRFECWLVWALR